jgi:hypothetical protein
MNERLKQLAEQAGIDFFNSTDPEYCGREYCEAWTEQQQKFAELIVKETLQVARAGIEFGPSMEDAVYTYFGVEE